MIKLLIANGDSFTAGDGMPDFKKNPGKKSMLTWPACLCRQAKIPHLLNVAESGCGSAQFVLRTTMTQIHYLLENSHVSPQEILVGILYGSYKRFELPIEGKGWIKGYWGNKEKMVQNWIRYCVSDASSSFYYFNDVLMLQILLEKLGIKYFMMSLFSDILTMNFQETKFFKKNINFDSFFFVPEYEYGAFFAWAEKNNYKMTPCSHFCEDAHSDFVNYHLIPWLNNRIGL